MREELTELQAVVLGSLAQISQANTRARDLEKAAEAAKKAAAIAIRKAMEARKTATIVDRANRKVMANLVKNQLAGQQEKLDEILAGVVPAKPHKSTKPEKVMRENRGKPKTQKPN